MIILCALLLFQTTIVDWMVEYVCPITSKVANDKWWVLIVVLITISILYVANIKEMLAERDKMVSRYWTILFLFAAYIIFRLQKEFVFHGIEWSPLSYMDCAWLVVLIFEICLYIPRKKNAEKEIEINKSYKPFLLDTPSETDEMGRSSYAEQLMEKLVCTRDNETEKKLTNGAFTILLNERYGVGKTTFMLQLEKMATEKGVDVCWFKPWLYDESKTLIVNLVHVIREQLGDGDKPLLNLLDRYARILSSVEKFEWVGVFQQETSSVETQYVEIKARLQEIRRPIIVLIDDVDRLHSEELMRLLQMVRNMADFPYLYYIVAGDKWAIQHRMEEAGVMEADEYLKKFFNIEICFPADDAHLIEQLRTGVNEIMGRYDGSKAHDVINYIQQLQYWREIFANIRDIKRFLNVLDFKLTNLKAKKMIDEVYMRDLAGICMIECIDSEFYRILRDHNEYVLTYSYQSYKVSEDYSNLFTSRDRKLIIDKIAKSKAKDSKIVGEVEKEISNIKTITDFERWTKPTKSEIIGEILEDLFPVHNAAPERTCICYRTEYFKYFSAEYKETEVSNADVIGFLVENEHDYNATIRQLLAEQKIIAFRNKLIWYFQTQRYDRMNAINRVMDAFDIEWEQRKDHNDDKYENLKTWYGLSLLAIFHYQRGEDREKGWKEWLKIKQRLETTKHYERRIFVYKLLKGDIPNVSSYIFKTTEEVNRSLKISEKQFVENVWRKSKYNAKTNRFIRLYRDMDLDISLMIINEILKIKRPEVFLYHLTYKPIRLLWNDGFIMDVVGALDMFNYEESKWSSIIPPKWKKEFLRFNMKREIGLDDIENSDFLRCAEKYWDNQAARAIKNHFILVQENGDEGIFNDENVN